MKNYKYILQGLDCANCAKKIEDAIAKKEEYKDVTVNFSTLKLSFKTDKEKAEVKKEIIQIIQKIEPEVKVIEEGKEENQEEHNNKDIIRIICGIAIYIIALIGKFSNIITSIITIIAFVILLYKTAKKAFKQVFKNKVLDENSLIVISAIGAYLVGKETEGLMVITLYEIGKILEARAVNKTRKSISDLMNIKPEYANLKKDNDEYKKVTPEEIKVGDIIVVKTGEKIPLDGEVISGNAQIDTSALTGESKLIQVKEKSKVLSGSININGLIEIRVEKTYENSTVSQILNLVENATDKKAKTETFVSKAAKIYTPVVMILAILIAVFMPLLISSVSYKESIYKALIFLVISCPCSIAISVPLSYFSGIGRASKKGILIKGSDFLDGIKDIKEIIFDKTGTITTGRFVVKEINSFDDKYSENEILEYFAKGEKFSNHPIAKSILTEYKKQNLDEINTQEIVNFEELAGKGLKYNYKNQNIKIGNSSFTEVKEENIEGTVLYLKIDEKVVGNIVLADEIKSKTKETIEKLNKLGIITKMFTGDKKEVAEKVAKEIGIKQVKAEMLPQDKYEELDKIINTREINKKVAFVGDGINDSPVLARADIGISMGGIGSSSAIEASDVVIMTDELHKIVEGINISKKTNKIIKQNLIFSITVKILTLILSLFGVAQMWQAVFADVGTTLITILNTIRILK